MSIKDIAVIVVAFLTLVLAMCVISWTMTSGRAGTDHTEHPVVTVTQTVEPAQMMDV